MGFTEMLVSSLTVSAVAFAVGFLTEFIVWRVSHHGR